jgi:hypothetical protein
MTLQERLAGFTTQTYQRVVRGDQAYLDTMAVTTVELQRLLVLHNRGGNLQHLRLIRDAIDHWLRRYHGYSIGGSIGTHYRTQGTERAGTVFEHVIPAKDLRDMMLSGALSIDEALNAPVCRITAEQDQQLRSAGLVSSTPDRWHFFRRYQVLSTEFVTHDGQPIADPMNYTLADHYQRFVPGYNDPQG